MNLLHRSPSEGGTARKNQVLYKVVYPLVHTSIWEVMAWIRRVIREYSKKHSAQYDDRGV